MPGGSSSGSDVDELLEIRTRCREEKEMLKDSQSQSFELIRKLEVHVRTLSEAQREDKKRIMELERELDNSIQEIDYLQDQLNARNAEVNFLGEHVCSLQLKLANLEIMEDEVGRVREELKMCDSERLFLLQQLEDKEMELQNSSEYIEKLEESISSIGLEHQCELESMKLELMTLDQNFFEAKKSMEVTAQENSRMSELIQSLELELQDSGKVIECLIKENKDLKEKLQESEMNVKVFGQNVEERRGQCQKINDDQDSSEPENETSFSEDVSGQHFSKLALSGSSDADLKDKVATMSHQIKEYEVHISQLKEELRAEKSKAKEEAEDLAQEMAELRYHMTELLEEERKRRAYIEQISLQRIAELEAQIETEQRNTVTLEEYRKSIISVKNIQEA